MPAAQVLHGAPHHTQLHAQLLRPSFGAVPAAQPCHPAAPTLLPPSPHTAHGRSFAQVERVQEVARQCLSTLVCLHKHGVIHCDLVRRAPTQAAACSAPSPLACLAAITQKPENILISSLTDCKVKVIDYGNAYLHHDQRCSYVQSRAYRAPEVVLGLPYSPKVDMWSLGCILMELFTGKLLFDNKSVQSLLASHIALVS